MDLIDLSEPTIIPGAYLIKTTSSEKNHMEKNWYLGAWRVCANSMRDNVSSWCGTYNGTNKNARTHWLIKPGSKPGQYTITFAPSPLSPEQIGWGLTTWFGHGAKRTDKSSRLAIHKDHIWVCEWIIKPVPGKANTFKIQTCYHEQGKTPDGGYLTAWYHFDGHRCKDSSWAFVHLDEQWAMDWELELVCEEKDIP